MPISANSVMCKNTAQTPEVRLCSGVSFCANPTPFMKTTAQKIREFHTDYKKSLGEVSLNDIVNITNKISATTGRSKEEVLSAMQTVTQFANMRSMKNIAKTLEESKISLIGDCDIKGLSSITSSYISHKDFVPAIRDVVFNNIGLHNTMYYLMARKGFGKLQTTKDMYCAIFLDNKKVAQLEALKRENPKTYEKFVKIPNLKFFMISGWESGINFINRDKDLETETRKLLKLSDKLKMPLDEVIDYKIMRRINKLGLHPKVIKREGLPNYTCVYNQMRPEQITRSELFNVLDANAQVRSKTIAEQVESKKAGIDFVKQHLKIYTPETLSKSLKGLHEKVLMQAKKQGYKSEDLLYIEPSPEKSYSLINYAYKEVNNIPDSQFLDISSLRIYRSKAKGKMLVLLDDCSVSGDSLRETATLMRRITDDNTPKLFACVCGTEKAKKRFSGKKNFDVIIGDIVKSYKSSTFQLHSNRIQKQIGKAEYSNGGNTCLILPYMSPDNNIGLGANVALYHNVNYRMSPGKGHLTISGTKNINESSRDVAILANDLTGSIPREIDSVENLYNNSPKSFYERIKDWWKS